jgi:hypothetical protein
MYSVKRGDTFELTAVCPVDFPAGPFTVACAARDETGATHAINAAMGTTVINGVTRQTLQLRQEANVTSSWPVGQMKLDVQFTDGAAPANVFSSKDLRFAVLQDQTP